MNNFLLVLVEPKLAVSEEAVLARVAELMAPYSEELLWTPHISECGLEDCDDPDHRHFREFARWDWFVIGGDWDGRVIGDEVADARTTRPWGLARNMRLVKDLPEDITYWSILTLDGWFDNPSPYIDRDDAVRRRWLTESTRLLGHYADYLAVGVHYHKLHCDLSDFTRTGAGAGTATVVGMKARAAIKYARCLVSYSSDLANQLTCDMILWTILAQPQLTLINSLLSLANNNSTGGVQAES